MSDTGKNFHEFALSSILFKGRSDWYFCYLKAEKISHVLTLLSQTSDPAGREELAEVGRRAGALASNIAHLAAGELDAPIVLADFFGLMSSVRLLGAREILNPSHTTLLIKEYEQVAVRLVRGSHPSPFLSGEEFSVPSFDGSSYLPRPAYEAIADIKDFKKTPTSKGQLKGHAGRSGVILDLVRSKKSLSIKDIAAVVTDCSEKTIQRELALLIEQGLVRKVGERRWSVYVPA
jgi:hypothetical protein